MVISESLAPGVGVLLRRAKVGTERFFLQLSFQFRLLLKQVLLVAAADRGNKTTQAGPGWIPRLLGRESKVLMRSRLLWNFWLMVELVRSRGAR